MWSVNVVVFSSFIVHTLLCVGGGGVLCGH